MTKVVSPKLSKEEKENAEYNKKIAYYIDFVD